MARFEVEGIDDIMKELETLGDIDAVAPKMINAAAPVLIKSMKKNISKATNRGYATGELEASIRATNARQNIYGYFSAVGPTGSDSKGVRNAEKMVYLEYGVSGKQEAHPVMAKTLHESEEEVIDVMQSIFNAEVRG